MTNPISGAIILTLTPVSDGPVAQLGAHYIRIVGVVGSNPIRSTNKKNHPKGWFFLLVWYSRSDSNDQNDLPVSLWYFSAKDIALSVSGSFTASFTGLDIGIIFNQYCCVFFQYKLVGIYFRFGQEMVLIKDIGTKAFRKIRNDLNIFFYV